MEKILCLCCLFALLCFAPAVLSLGAEVPILQDVLPSDDVLRPGDAFTVSFDASQAGTLHAVLYPPAEAAPIPYQDIAVGIGQGSLSWDGRIQAEDASPGRWQLGVVLENAAGQSSAEHRAIVEVLSDEASSTPSPIPELPSATPRPHTPITRYPDAGEDSFWQMDIQDFDIYDPDTQQALWRYLCQPITVMDTSDPRDHIYPLGSPGADSKVTANLTGQLHGLTQGVHAVRAQEGWTLIEAYSNDGIKAPSKKLYDFAGQFIEGWVPSSKLKTIETDGTVGLVIDKLYQKMYIFEQGVMTGELLVSTGKPTKDSPNVETPAGEFIIDSWVGMFESYGLMCDLALRINGGVLIHEVPHLVNADGTRNYRRFEPHLGEKASHGCIRVQRTKNDQGQNITWLWDHMKRNAKVIIIDDAGRSLPPPDMDTVLYYNLNKGKYYHADAYCPGVKKEQLPLTGVITYADLYGDFDYLTPCPDCKPPAKVE